MKPSVPLNIKNVYLYYCLSYPSCKMHLFYTALQLLSILASLAAHYFSTFHHKRCDFRWKESIFNVKCVLIFSKILKHFLSPTKSVISFLYMHLGLHTKYAMPYQIKLELSRHILHKSTNIKFHENSFSRRWVVPCGQRDGRTDRQIWWS